MRGWWWGVILVVDQTWIGKRIFHYFKCFCNFFITHNYRSSVLLGKTKSYILWNSTILHKERSAWFLVIRIFLNGYVSVLFFPQSENSGSLQLKDFLGKFDAECFCTEQSNALLLCVHEFLSGRFLQCLNSASPLLKIYSLIQINASKEIERNRPLSMNDISLVLGQIILTTTTT